MTGELHIVSEDLLEWPCLSWRDNYSPMELMKVRLKKFPTRGSRTWFDMTAQRVQIIRRALVDGSARDEGPVNAHAHNEIRPSAGPRRSVERSTPNMFSMRLISDSVRPTGRYILTQVVNCVLRCYIFHTNFIRARESEECMVYGKFELLNNVLSKWL